MITRCETVVQVRDAGPTLDLRHLVTNVFLAASIPASATVPVCARPL